MFNRKLKDRIDYLESLLKAERYRSEMNRDGEHSYMEALSSALTKDIITMEQYREIYDLQTKYFNILRDHNKGA